MNISDSSQPGPDDAGRQPGSPSEPSQSGAGQPGATQSAGYPGASASPAAGASDGAAASPAGAPWSSAGPSGSGQSGSGQSGQPGYTAGQPGSPAGYGSGQSAQSGYTAGAQPGYAPSTQPGSTPPFSNPSQPGYASPEHPRPAAGFFDSMRRAGLVRTEDRWVGGVAGGLARRLGVDPILVRCVWAVICLFTGVGALVYGLAWAFLPEERDGRIHAQQVLDGDVSAGLAGAIAMTLLGLGTIDSGIGLGTVWAGTAMGALVVSVLWPVLVLTLLVVVVILLLRGLKDRHARRHRPAPPACSPAPGSPAGPWPGTPGAPGTPGTAGMPGMAAAQDAVGAVHAGYPAGAAAPGAPAYAAPRSAYPAQSADAAAQSVYTAASAEAAAQSVYSAPAAPAPGTPASTFPSPAPATPAGPEPTSVYDQVSGAGSQAAASAINPAGQPTYPTYPPNQPARPRKRRAPGPGKRMSLTVLALGLLAEAAVLVAWASGTLSYPATVVIAFGAPTALLGAGVLISGLRGRRATWMTGVGWLVAVVCVPVLAAASFMPAGTITSPTAGGNGLEVSERYPRTITVTDAMLAGAGTQPLDLGSFSAGAVVIDLTGVTTPHPGARLSTAVGGGTITLKTRMDLPVRLDATYRGAHLYGRTSTQWRTGPGSRVSTYDTDGNVTAYGLGDTQFDLNGEPLRTWTLDDLGFGLQEGRIRAESGAAADAPDQAIEVTARVGIGGIRVYEYPEETTWEGQIFEDRWIVSGWTDTDGYHGNLARDWPVPGMTNPAVKATDANQCLATATQWARDERDRLSQEADSSSQESEDSASEDRAAERWAEAYDWEAKHNGDLYPSLWTLEDLSSHSQSAFTACLDHVLAGEPVDSFAPPAGSGSEPGASSGSGSGSGSGSDEGDDAGASPEPGASPSTSPTSAEAVVTSVTTISAAGRGTEGH